jgi:hypothetical protein
MIDTSGALRGDRAHLGLGIADVLEVAVGDVAQAVAAGAHFLVDLEAALELLAVELAERAGEAPPAFGPVRMLVIFELRRLLGLARGDPGSEAADEGDGADQNEAQAGKDG